MKWILAKLCVVAVALCLSACTVVSVTSREYVDSIGNEAYSIGWENQREIYYKDGAYYARVPLLLEPVHCSLISVETLSISSEGSYHRFSYPQYRLPQGKKMGEVYVKVELRKWNPRHAYYEDVAAPNAASAPNVLTDADVAGLNPILRIPCMEDKSPYVFKWDYGFTLYDNERSWLNYSLYPVQGVCLVLDVTLSVALTPIAFLLYDLGPL